MGTMVTMKTPRPGMPVTATWGAAVTQNIQSQNLIAGPNILLTKTNNGTVIDVNIKKTPQQKQETFNAVPCIITGINQNAGVAVYDVDIYENGIWNQPTGTGTLFPLQFSPQSILPIGTVVLGFTNSVQTIQGT